MDIANGTFPRKIFQQLVIATISLGFLLQFLSDNGVTDSASAVGRTVRFNYFTVPDQALLSRRCNDVHTCASPILAPVAATAVGTSDYLISCLSI